MLALWFLLLHAMLYAAIAMQSGGKIAALLTGTILLLSTISVVFETADEERKHIELLRKRNRPDL